MSATASPGAAGGEGVARDAEDQVGCCGGRRGCRVDGDGELRDPDLIRFRQLDGSLGLVSQCVKLRVEHGKDRSEVLSRGGCGEAWEESLQVLAVRLDEPAGHERTDTAGCREEGHDEPASRLGLEPNVEARECQGEAGEEDGREDS
jgi:hypothetical protein